MPATIIQNDAIHSVALRAAEAAEIAVKQRAEILAYNAKQLLALENSTSEIESHAQNLAARTVVLEQMLTVWTATLPQVQTAIANNAAQIQATHALLTSINNQLQALQPLLVNIATEIRGLSPGPHGPR